MGLDELVKCLPGLSSLTSLAMQEVSTEQCLPVQLKQLPCNRFDLYNDAPCHFFYGNWPNSVNLGHLTALTKLELNPGMRDCEETGKLPRRIRSLKASPCRQTSWNC